VRLAVCQAPAVSGDVPGNTATAAELVVRAGDAGGELAVLPELYLPGYDVDGLLGDRGLDVDEGRLHDDARLDPLREACRSTRTTAVVGAAVRRGDSRRLSVLVVGADGAASAPYDKQHLWATESSVFDPGTHGAVLELAGWRVGLGVCYDGGFPEHARAAALAGAALYVCPVAYVVGSEHRRDLYYRARALDNGMYVAVAGLVGPCGPNVFSGGSAVLDPEGRVVVQAGADPRTVLVAEIDADVVARTRVEHPMLAAVRG